MKRHVIILSTVLAAVSLVGCNESQSVSDIKGTYSYKNSGSIVVGGESVRLIDESGQLNVVSMHNGDSVLMTMNQIAGPAYCTTATANGDGVISLKPYARRMTIIFDTTRLVSYPAMEDFDVTVSGRGKFYDKTIILDLTYVGVSKESSHTFKSEQVTMIAKRN